jgi:hypothetical protein
MGAILPHHRTTEAMVAETPKKDFWLSDQAGRRQEWGGLLSSAHVLPHRARLKLGIHDVDLDQVANGYEAEKPTSLNHRHVAEPMDRHFRHQSIDRVGLSPDPGLR